MSIVNGAKITTLMVSAANGDTYGDAERRVFRGIQTLVQPTILSIFGNTPPASPTNGQTYIVGPAPTGVWTGQPNAVAYWAVDPQDGVATTGIWDFYTPQLGWSFFNQATGSLITFNGTAWVAFIATVPFTAPSPVAPVGLALTSVATSVGSTAVYTGTITGGASNALAGQTFTVVGFVTSANNGTFLATASTATSLTLANSAAVSETHAATATSNFSNSVINAALGNNFSMLLNSNLAFSIINPTDGQTITVLWVQNATGGWVPIYPSNVHSIGFLGGAAAASPVTTQLASAATLALLAYSGVTSSVTTNVIGGNVTSGAGSSSVTGTINYTAPAAAVTFNSSFQTDLAAAIVFFQGITPFTAIGATYATNTFTATATGYNGAPGFVGFASSTLAFTGGTITLDGAGLTNPVFVFQVGSALNVTTAATTVNCINGATPANVVWVVGTTATFDAHDHVWVGDILAHASITLNSTTLMTLAGRALANTGALTISNTTTITVPAAGASGAFHAFPSTAPNSVSSQTFTYNAALLTWYQTALGTYGL